MVKFNIRILLSLQLVLLKTDPYFIIFLWNTAKLRICHEISRKLVKNAAKNAILRREIGLIFAATNH